nr:unnamed protein product [Naegleria fowleri]
MERRVNRAQGERTEEEKVKLNAQIDKLQKSLEEHETQFEMIKGEWTKVLSEVRKMKKETDEKELEKARLNEKVHDLTLENNSLEEEMRALTREKEDLLVQHDIQKLQVKRMRDLLRARTDELSGLENRKYQLETLYIEKEQKVKAHKEMLAAEWKAYEDQRRKLSLELSNRRVHIDKLKNKYNIMIQRLKPDVEGEEEVSQAQFLIRAIQEREELQRIGDKLDEEIQKLENHDRGLEKTLSLFKTHNINHNAHYKKVDTTDPDICLKMELENKCKDLDTLTSKRIQEQYEYEESANRKQKELEMVLIEQKETEIKRDALSTSKAVLEKDISKLLSSLSTQKTLLKSNLKEIKKIPDADALLQDITLTDNKLKNRNCLLTLSFISESNPVLKSNLDKLLKDEGLSMPVLSRPASSMSVLSSRSAKSSTTRSVNSSQRSSTSSVRRVANTSIISLQ